MISGKLHWLPALLFFSLMAQAADSGSMDLGVTMPRNAEKNQGQDEGFNFRGMWVDAGVSYGYSTETERVYGYPLNLHFLYNRQAISLGWQRVVGHKKWDTDYFNCAFDEKDCPLDPPIPIIEETSLMYGNVQDSGQEIYIASIGIAKMVGKNMSKDGKDKDFYGLKIGFNKTARLSSALGISGGLNINLNQENKYANVFLSIALGYI